MAFRIRIDNLLNPKPQAASPKPQAAARLSILCGYEPTQPLDDETQCCRVVRRPRERVDARAVEAESRRMADLRRRPGEHAIFAARSNQREQLQQVAARVPVQERITRTATRIPVSRKACDCQRLAYLY